MSDFYAPNEKRQNSGGFDPNTFGKKLIIYLCISIFVVSGLNVQTEIDNKKTVNIKTSKYRQTRIKNRWHGK